MQKVPGPDCGLLRFQALRAGQSSRGAAGPYYNSKWWCWYPRSGWQGCETGLGNKDIELMEQMLEFWRNSEKRKQSIIISLNNVKTTNGILSLIYSHTFNVRSRGLRAVGCFTSSPGNILCFIILIRNSAPFYLCQIKPNSKLWHRFKA